MFLNLPLPLPEDTNTEAISWFLLATTLGIIMLMVWYEVTYDHEEARGWLKTGGEDESTGGAQGGIAVASSATNTDTEASATNTTTSATSVARGASSQISRPRARKRERFGRAAVAPLVEPINQQGPCPAEEPVPGAAP